MRLGLDVTSVAQWRARLGRAPAVASTAFSTCELAWCDGDVDRFTRAWAVKEAMVKLLGTGFDGIGWRGVWSQPDRQGANLDVGLGPDASAALAARGLSTPLQWCLIEDGDEVAVVLMAGAGRVAVRSEAFARGGTRRARHQASRRAAREAGLMAATDLAASSPSWWRTRPDEPPMLVHADGSDSIASLAHGPEKGWAAVAMATEGPQKRSDRRSGPLTFMYDDGAWGCDGSRRRLWLGHDEKAHDQSWVEGRQDPGDG